MANKPTSDFLAAQKVLKKKFDAHPALNLVNSRLSGLQPRSGWSLINELIQNAVDIKATHVKFTYTSNGNLKFQHNARKSPLDTKSIVGLCGVAESTKGLNTVGFMGIGFKFFTKFFTSVTISDQKTCFGISYPIKGNWKDKLKCLYSPKWISNGDYPTDVYTTSFYFKDVIPEIASKIDNVFHSIDLEMFPLFVKQGLQEIIFEDCFNEDANGFVVKGNHIRKSKSVQISEGDNSKNFLVLEESITASKSGKEFVVNKRSLDPELAVDAELTRTVSMVIEVVEDSERWIPIPGSTGELFCLVPLPDSKFPFKIGLDADWFMDSERTELDRDVHAVNWHSEMITPTLPVLIKKYLDVLGPKLIGEKRQKATDIFPTNANFGDEFIFLSNDTFKQNLAVQISSSKFILCTDGELRYISEVKNIEDLPGGEKHYDNYYRRWQITDVLDQETYKQFTECADVPIIDRNSISPNTVNYLSTELDMLHYPNISDYNVEKIRNLWNPKHPSKYLHILDMLSSMSSYEEDNMMVVPLNDGEWADLFDENLVFESLPAESNEKNLYEHLIDYDSRFENLVEIHDALKYGLKTRTHYGEKWGDASGNTWKKSILGNSTEFYESSIKVSQVVSEIKDPPDELIISILYFALRTDNPQIVNYLTTQDGVSKVNDCLIPPPHANNNLEPIEGNRIISESVIEILNSAPAELNIKKFLTSAGLINFLPFQVDTYSRAPNQVRKETGVKVGHDGPHRTTAASESYWLPKHWTIIDWRWPIGFDKFTTDSITIYLSQPSDELKNFMRNASKAKKTRAIKYFFSTDKGPYYAGMDNSWLKDLKSKPWVKCSDGELRIPSRSPIQGSDSTSKFFANLDEKTIELYMNLGLKFESSLDDLTEKECMELWQSQQVRIQSFFLKKLKSWDASNEEKISYAQETIWATGGELFETTKLKYFVHNPSTTLGGYVGKTELIDDSITEYLEEIGFSFPQNEDSELICNCVSELVDLYKKRKTRKICDILQDCWRLIAERGFEVNEQPVLNTDLKIVSLKDKTLHIHPFQHDKRFELSQYSLYHNQFPPELLVLRNLSNASVNLNIIDDIIDSEPVKETLTVSANLSRIVLSMGLNLELFLFNKSHLWKFQEKEAKINIVVKSESQPYRIFLSNESNGKGPWIDDLCNLLINQKGEQFRDSYKPLRELISNHNTIAKVFDTLYSQFCSQYGLQKVSISDVQKEAESANSSIVEKKTMKKSLPAKLRIADQKKPVGPKENGHISQDKKDKTKSESKNYNTVTTVERDHEIETEHRKDSVFSDDQIGDRAEESVRKHLEEKEWKVVKSNQNVNNNPGYDLEATKGDITRYIEVKGRRREWDSVAMSHQQGLHFFRTVEKDNGKGNLEYWICVVEKILNEEQTDVSKEEPKLHAINLTLEKPKHIFNRTQWRNRNRPDKDF